MNNPKSENVLTVIRNFEKVLPMAKMESQLDMSIAQVTTVGCGTTHCHGGWYAVAVCDLSNFVGFDHGAKKMAKTLAFKDFEELSRWAFMNQEIWGNGRGIGMFCSPEAFTSADRPNGAKSLNDIVDHWKEVYERLVILEGKESELNKPKQVICYVSVPQTINEQAKKLILS